ncbi:hypothetical protein BBJ28_00002497 [Nothophytophthora sp. Chile5]|nr:hypothetical protein BBJ28_00002497 [Nothophytophthora sp. Chile5]
MVQVLSILCAVLAATASVTSAWPTSKGSVRFNGVKTIKKGETFDGGMKTYQRSDITCKGQSEGDWKDAVFRLEAGAKLKNEPSKSGSGVSKNCVYNKNKIDFY